jgi:NADPH-dependent curcumin reductase CurA
MTAYFRRSTSDKKPGNIVLVSGAAGAVGQTVGQLAHIGRRAVGIAGGPAKCEWVVGSRLHACIDYKAAPPCRCSALRRSAG